MTYRPITPRLVRALRTNADRAHRGANWHLFGARNRRIWQIADAYRVHADVARIIFAR